MLRTVISAFIFDFEICSFGFVSGFVIRISKLQKCETIASAVSC